VGYNASGKWHDECAARAAGRASAPERSGAGNGESIKHERAPIPSPPPRHMPIGHSPHARRYNRLSSQSSVPGRQAAPTEWQRVTGFVFDSETLSDVW
jgi:hypothetical protein